MNNLPKSKELSQRVGTRDMSRDRKNHYYIWLRKVKDVLLNNPTIREISELKKEIGSNIFGREQQARRLDRWIKNNHNNKNEKFLKELYSSFASDLDVLYEYISEIKVSDLTESEELRHKIKELKNENERLEEKISQLEEKQSFYQIFWNWIKPKYIA